jgi:DNA topoisomerase VI subunit B
MYVLIPHPRHLNLKYLITQYSDKEENARDKAVKKYLTLPQESKKDLIVVVETEFEDLSDSLQKILSEKIKANNENKIIFRTFLGTDNNSLLAETNMDLYNLIYDDIDWTHKKENSKTLN